MPIRLLLLVPYQYFELPLHCFCDPVKHSDPRSCRLVGLVGRAALEPPYVYNGYNGIFNVGGFV